MQYYRLPTMKFGREGVWRYNGLCVLRFLGVITYVLLQEIRPLCFRMKH